MLYGGRIVDDGRGDKRVARLSKTYTLVFWVKAVVADYVLTLAHAAVADVRSKETKNKFSVLTSLWRSGRRLSACSRSPTLESVQHRMRTTCDTLMW